MIHKYCGKNLNNIDVSIIRDSLTSSCKAQSQSKSCIGVCPQTIPLPLEHVRTFFHSFQSQESPHKKSLSLLKHHLVLILLSMLLCDIRLSPVRMNFTSTSPLTTSSRAGDSWPPGEKLMEKSLGIQSLTNTRSPIPLLSSKAHRRQSAWNFSMETDRGPGSP